MQEKTLLVFDMDDTLLVTPRLSDILTIENNQIVTEDNNIKEYIKKLKRLVFIFVF